jgi:hypothetical protein
MLRQFTLTFLNSWSISSTLIAESRAATIESVLIASTSNVDPNVDG